MSTTLRQVPVIDFELFRVGDEADSEAIAQQIHHAFHHIGFLYLKNLGVSPDLVERLFHQSKQFFNLPFEQKNQLAWADELSNRGYVGVERERLDPNRPGDLKEAFNVGKEVISNSANSSQQDSLTVNRWTADLPEFQATVLEFYDACAEAAINVLKAIAFSLQLPNDFFDHNHDQQNHTLRLLHYPPSTQTPKPGQVRAGEHSDYGSITLLFQDLIGGLEVQTAQGEWIDAPAIPGTVVVNTGDLMQRWTNHEFCSTKHRVRIPTDERIGRSRYSAAFFCHPNDNTEISCIESCQSATNLALYPPIAAGEYLLSRLRATH